MAEGSKKVSSMKHASGDHHDSVAASAADNCVGESAFEGDAPPDVVMLSHDMNNSITGSFISTLDNSMASNSKPRTSKHAKKRLSAEKKLEEINAQLAAIRKEREESTAKKTGRVMGKRTDYSKRPKKSFHHPNLELVMGELIYSPYRIHPLATYPDETFRMSEKLKELRQNGQKFEELPDEEKPFDLKHVKRSFMSEIANYNPGFNIKAVRAERNLMTVIVMIIYDCSFYYSLRSRSRSHLASNRYVYVYSML